MANICVKMDVHYTYCQGDYFVALLCFYLKNAILSLPKPLVTLRHVSRTTPHMSTQRMETVTGHVSVLCMCVSPCLWDTCLASPRVESARGKVAAMSPSLGRDPGSPGTRLGSSSRAGESWAGAAGGDYHAPNST